MNIIDYYEKFEEYEDLKDDNRLRILTSDQQKIIYAFARKNQFITLDVINSLYSELKNMERVITKLLALKILKKIDEARFEYIESESGDKSLENKDTLFDQMKDDNEKESGEL